MNILKNLMVSGSITGSSGNLSGNLFVSGSTLFGGPGSHSFELQSDTGPANLGPILTFRNAAGAIKGQIGHYNADLGRLIIAGGDNVNESLASMQFGISEVKLQTTGNGYGFDLTTSGLTFQNGTPLTTTGPVSASNLKLSNDLIVSGSATIGNNAIITGSLKVTQNITASIVSASTLIGDGSQITGLTGTSVTVQDEGSTITSAVTSFNFVGNGVTATNSGNAVTVTISSGSVTATPKSTNVAITTSPALTNVLTGVPSGKSWRIKNMSVINDSGSAVTYNLQLSDGTTTIFIDSGSTLGPRSANKYSGIVIPNFGTSGTIKASCNTSSSLLIQASYEELSNTDSKGTNVSLNTTDTNIIAPVSGGKFDEVISLFIHNTQTSSGAFNLKHKDSGSGLEINLAQQYTIGPLGTVIFEDLFLGSGGYITGASSGSNGYIVAHVGYNEFNV